MVPHIWHQSFCISEKSDLQCTNQRCKGIRKSVFNGIQPCIFPDRNFIEMAPSFIWAHAHRDVTNERTHFSELPMLNGTYNPTRQTKERKSSLYWMFGWLNTLLQSSLLLARRSPLLLPILPLIQPSDLSRMHLPLVLPHHFCKSCLHSRIH